ncbi:unnamed protein product [Linum trigynum]|uniref:Uncharacterized protein n=1 Tax=Linum trigynum TaxID=586398 RepID=A0AAV2FMD0_9ROSI
MELGWGIGLRSSRFRYIVSQSPSCESKARPCLPACTRKEEKRNLGNEEEHHCTSFDVCTRHWSACSVVVQFSRRMN